MTYLTSAYLHNVAMVTWTVDAHITHRYHVQGLDIGELYIIYGKGRDSRDDPDTELQLTCGGGVR